MKRLPDQTEDCEHLYVTENPTEDHTNDEVLDEPIDATVEPCRSGHLRQPPDQYGAWLNSVNPDWGEM